VLGSGRPAGSDPLQAGDPCPPGTDFAAPKAEFKKRYPPDLPGEDYRTNHFLATDGNDHRSCKIARVALCPLGERRRRERWSVAPGTRGRPPSAPRTAPP